MDTLKGTKIPHILLLEDDMVHQDLILRAFRDDPEQFRVSTAGTILEARPIVERDPPDLIIADWNLPDGKGLDILPRTDGIVTIPLVITTSFGDERLAVEIMKSGAIDYVVKSATAFKDLPRIAQRALRDWKKIQMRTRAEETVRDSQKRIADILAFLPDPVLAIDQDGIVIAWNNAMEELTGVPAGEMLGKGDHEYSIPFYGIRRSILVDLVLEEDTEAEKKYLYIKRDGTKIFSETFIPGMHGGKGAHLWGVASPLFDAGGHRAGAIEVIRNITERKRAEEALKTSQFRLSEAMDLAQLVNWEFDALTGIFTFNDRFYAFYGTTAEREGGYQMPAEEYARRFVHPDDQHLVAEEVNKALQATDPQFVSQVEHRIIRRDGEVRTVVVRFGIIKDENGRTVKTRGANQDITTRRKAEDALQESEKKYRFLIDNVRDIVWQTTPDLTFTYVSPVAETLTGYSPDDLIGTSLFAILTEPSARVVQQRLEERMEEYSHGSRDLSTVFEAEIRKKDGNLLWIEVSSNAVFGPDGTIIGFQGISRDISERKRAEKSVVESEVRFRDLFNNMSSGVVIYEATPDGKDFIIRDVNRSAEKIDHVKKEDIAGRSVLEVFSGVVEFGLFAVFQRVAKTGIPESHPVSMYHDNRISGWRENYVYKLPSGEVVAIYEDVTEKKQAEEKLRESEEKYHGLYDGMRDAFASMDMAGRITLFNEPFQKMLGYEKDEIYHLTYNDLTPEKWHAIEMDIIKNQVLTRGYSEIYEKEYQRKDGTVFPVELRAFLVRDNAGNPQGMSAVVRDITERKRIEMELQATEYQLSTIYRNISEVLFFLSVEENDRYRFITVNQPFLDITGLTREQVVGRYVDEVIPEPSLTLVLGKYKQAILENSTSTWEEITEYPAGVKWGEVRVTPLFDATGRCTNLVGSVHDITERKLAEEKLRESEERYRALLNGAGIGVGYWSTDGTLLYLNDISYKRIGAKEADLIGKNMRELFGDTADMYLGRLNKAMVSQDPAEYEDYVHLPTGDGWYLSVYTRITHPDGTVAGIQIISMDITPRKLAEETRRAYEVRLDSAMEIGSLAWWEMDLPEGTVRFDDRKATMLGYSPGQFTHYTDFTVLLHPDDLEPAMQAMRNHLEGRDARYHADYRILTAAGVYRWFRDVGGITRRKTDGSPATVTGIVIDITPGKVAEGQIRESEEKFRDIFNSVNDSVEIHEMDENGLPGRFIEVNDVACRMLQYTRDEMLTKSPMDFTTDYYSRPLEKIGDELKTLGHATFETRHRKKDGTIVAVEINAHVTTILGKVVVVSVVRDITERKRSEDMIRESETRFRALIQNSSDIIRVLDQDGRIIYESPSAGRILGYPPGYLIGRNPLEYIHPDDLERVTSDFREVIAKTNPGTPTEFRMRKADGEYIWVDSIGMNLLEVPGVNGIVITTRPIQQRKEAEQAMRDSEERLRLALEGAGAASWDWHLPSGTMIFNDRFYHMLDYEPGEFPATYDGWVALMHPEERDHVLMDLNDQIRRKRPLCEIEYRLLTKGGDWIWILCRGKIADFDDRGNPVRLTGVNIDITNRRLLESEIRSLNTVLEQRIIDRTEALSKANEALEEENAQRLTAEAKLRSSLEEKTVLLKEIHHRVKNNLQIIASLLNLQSRYIRDESTLAAIRESQNRVKAMALVHEKLYKSEDLAHIDLNEYIRFLGTGLFQFYDARSRGIRFTLEIHDVHVDINTAIPLGLILNELISNSLKYAFPEGRAGEVSISIRKDARSLTVLFHDDGIGIPKTLDWKETQSLGLRLVNTLIDQMNGTIELDRTAGTRFTMVLHEKEQRGPS